ncbi:DPP IV N-terminal domain-containing protein, partial [Crocinitomix catalasitica]|nr:DPP IV N-terminal domain-containing protein [Crocinitomix catalasitica]
DGSKVGFVYQNNIYFRDLKTDEVFQITTDGSQNEIINGSTDWVYEEEFEITKAFYWSPEGTKIAYLKFDESSVRDFTMDYYRGGTYPNAYTFKYPKAGEDNSRLSLYIYNLEDKSTVEIDYGNAEYVPRMRWTTDDDELIILTLNRHQSELTYVSISCGQPKASLRTIFTEKSDTFIEVDDNLIFLEDGSGFLRCSEASAYRHIYKVGFDGKVEAVTNGEWDVHGLKGVNEKSGRVFYTSSERGAIYQDLYSIKMDGSRKIRLSSRSGNNSPDFSTGMKYYINYHSSSSSPLYISVHDSEGKEITTLVDNADYINQLEEYQLSKKEFITIKGVEHELNAWIVKPPNFDATKKYPVYFNIYTGPNSNTVTDSWGGSSGMYLQLLAQKGYIIISVDTRGTGRRGTKFRKCTYLQLGKLETEDMIAAAKEVQKWEFVDPDRIGVMGWSYGGYMSSLCLTKGADVFKMAIAVAPVTNWRWYDNIYTERYMRTPKENPNGYDDNSPINHVEKMKGKYLLVHGSGDDNVHVQNSMEMVDALVRKNVDFDMFIYTNKSHGIGGGYTREHLFSKMLAFTLENL